MRNTIVSALCLGLSLGLGAATASAQDSPILLKGAKVFTGAGAFQDLDVVMHGGKITAIGKGLEAPAGAQTVDVSGQFVTPGLVDANTSLGLPSAHENEQSSEVTPHMRALEAIDPQANAFRHALRDGVTSAYVSPGGNNVFGGLGVVIKTAGGTLQQRLLREDAGLRMTLGKMPSQGNSTFRGNPNSMYVRRPTNRMGTIWEIRKTFYAAMDKRETQIGPSVPLDSATKVLIEALDQKIKVRTTARADEDIRTAIRLANEFNLKIVIDGAIEAYHALDYIVAAGFPVVAEPPSVMNSADNSTAHTDTLKLLAEAGVPVAIQTGQGLGALPLVREASFAVRGGMKREAALASITSVPAKILGVDERVGSLAQGKDADVVVWSRHPLSPVSRATQIWVNGNSVQQSP